MKKGLLLAALLVLLANGISAQSWTEVTTFNQVIHDLKTFDGKLFIGGNFTKREGSTCYNSSYYNGTTFKNNTVLATGIGVSEFGIFDFELYATGAMQHGSSVGLSNWNSIDERWGQGGSFTSSHSGIYADATTLYVGSDFGIVSTRTTTSGFTQYPLLEGFNKHVSAITKYNGDLVVAGGFRTSAGDTLNYIARWDGSAWKPLGTGLSNGQPRTMAVYNGDLYVGGYFERAGGVNAKFIAKWDGTAWSDVGGSVTDNSQYNGIRDMLVFNNELYVVGDFSEIGNVNARFGAKWNGTTWTSLDINIAHKFVNTLEVYGNDLYVGTFDFDTTQLLKMTISTSTSNLALPDNSWSIYPNPAQNMLNISLANTGTLQANVEIRDVSGKLMQQQAVINTTQLNCGNLSTGLYFVTLKDSETGALLGVKRFVKE